MIGCVKAGEFFHWLDGPTRPLRGLALLSQRALFSPLFLFLLDFPNREHHHSFQSLPLNSSRSLSRLRVLSFSIAGVGFTLLAVHLAVHSFFFTSLACRFWSLYPNLPINPPLEGRKEKNYATDLIRSLVSIVLVCFLE